MPPKNQKKRGKTTKPHSMPKRTAKVAAKMLRRPKSAPTQHTRAERYTEAPKVMGTDLSFPAERLSHTAMGLTISRFEFIDTVSIPTTNNFFAGAYVVNPGNPLVFPYLTTIARNYMSYRFKKLIFHYVAKAKSDLDGSVTLATVVNPSYPVPASDRLMMEIEGAVTGPLWTNKHVKGNISGKDLTGGLWKLIGYNSVYPGSSSYPSQDAGAFFVAVTSGVAAEKDIGAVYVEYEVELRQPIVNPLVSLVDPNAAISVNQALPSDLDVLGRATISDLLAQGGSSTAPWEDSKQVDPLAQVAINSATGAFDTRSRQFAYNSRRSTGVYGYDMISATRAAAAGGPGNLINFYSFNPANVNNINGFGIFPATVVSCPGVFAFQLSTSVSWTSGAFAITPYLTSATPYARDASGATIQSGYLPGSGMGMSPYVPVTGASAIPLTYHIRAGFWVNIPPSASFPVDIRIPCSILGVSGVGASASFSATVEPYQLFGGVGEHKEDIKPANDFDEEALIDKVVARMRIAEESERVKEPSSNDTSPVHVSGSGALSESGFSLLSDLLQRRKR